MSASKLAASASETIIGKLIDDIYSYLKEHVGEKIKIWQIEQKTKQAKRIKKQIQNIQRVKTLWQVDKAVDLNQFYCDSHVILDKERVKIKSIKDLLPRKQIIISGIAGQGKSILLRYLCGNTLRQGEYLPVFIELRRILSPDTLELHMILYFKTMGLSLDEKLLRLLLASGKIIILLDGFDEIQETEKPKIINEIEQLGHTYDQMSIIITSRPESGIEVCPIFEVVKLDDLRTDEYKQVIRKLSHDSKFADTLIKQIDLRKPNLRELLCTPLLVTLLVMAYKSYQDLPAQLSDFYDSIFQVLLQRHDGVKPGYKRRRRCNLNDSQYRVIFECMCYYSKRIIKSIFTYDELCKFSKEAFSIQKILDQSDSYLKDIIQVTCLILKDGEYYRFIHKSVQEYYAASYIKHRTEYNAQKFYSGFVELSEEELDRRGIWGQELRFLSEIDQYRYNK
ncbi:MAG: NACHT domain-containing protein, partial [Methanosarcinaceae archaeon]|nr:NACHT domain-containing protein [Methanosarcinaceae archaeon]